MHRSPQRPDDTAQRSRGPSAEGGRGTARDSKRSDARERQTEASKSDLTCVSTRLSIFSPFSWMRGEDACRAGLRRQRRVWQEHVAQRRNRRARRFARQTEDECDRTSWERQMGAVVLGVPGSRAEWPSTWPCFVREQCLASVFLNLPQLVGFAPKSVKAAGALAALLKVMRPCSQSAGAKNGTVPPRTIPASPPSARRRRPLFGLSRQ